MPRPTLLVCLLLAVVTPATPTNNEQPLLQMNANPGPVTLHLRHIHAANPNRILFADVNPSPYSSQHAADSDAQIAYTVGTVPQRTHRPSSPAAHAQARINSMRYGAGMLSWDEDEVPAPDVTSRETLLVLAQMTSNAYYGVPGEAADWYDLDGAWNVSYPFGWEDGADGLRGHVFASDDNQTVAVSIKGTSAPFVGGGGPTVGNDKLNNNLLFSCCCANVGFSWTPVCGCSAGGWKCDRDCIEESLWADSSFYPVGTSLYNNISYMYPQANIWLIGHSLGGALASLLGVTFGVPVVAFESPGEKMAARRLHLPSPPSTQHVTHVYHTADPVPMGTCTGVLSTCALAGFAMESRCHLGKTVLYDTVTKLSWSVSIVNHKISVVIDLLAEDRNWAPEGDDEEYCGGAKGEKGEGERGERRGGRSEGRNGENSKNSTTRNYCSVPSAVPEEDCIECYKWEYGDFLDRGSW